MSVPLDAEITDPTPDKGGQFHVDGNKLMKAAVRLGTDPDTQWSPECEPTVEPHPIQSPPSSNPALK